MPNCNRAAIGPFSSIKKYFHILNKARMSNKIGTIEVKI